MSADWAAPCRRGASVGKKALLTCELCTKWYMAISMVRMTLESSSASACWHSEEKTCVHWSPSRRRSLAWMAMLCATDAAVMRTTGHGTENAKQTASTTACSLLVAMTCRQPMSEAKRLHTTRRTITLVTLQRRGNAATRGPRKSRASVFCSWNTQKLSTSTSSRSMSNTTHLAAVTRSKSCWSRSCTFAASKELSWDGSFRTISTWCKRSISSGDRPVQAASTLRKICCGFSHPQIISVAGGGSSVFCPARHCIWCSCWISCCCTPSIRRSMTGASMVPRGVERMSLGSPIT
mmetsp:Transcript_92501/g.160330  ORF Transcript_92501/g.160330 Transcript_92501/m.160330 type:complete len:293 (+) Transcript_92501:908-1786(+)